MTTAWSCSSRNLWVKDNEPDWQNTTVEMEEVRWRRTMTKTRQRHNRKLSERQSRVCTHRAFTQTHTQTRTDHVSVRWSTLHMQNCCEVIFFPYAQIANWFSFCTARTTSYAQHHLSGFVFIVFGLLLLCSQSSVVLNSHFIPQLCAYYIVWIEFETFLKPSPPTTIRHNSRTHTHSPRFIIILHKLKKQSVSAIIKWTFKNNEIANNIIKWIFFFGPLGSTKERNGLW